MENNVNHPKYKYTLDQGDSIIVVFQVGHYVEPDVETQEAAKRIQAIVNKIDPKDLALIEKWGGRVMTYPITSKINNPEITDAMAQEFITVAKEAYPEKQIATSWENAQHGMRGYSVQMVNKKGA